MRDDNFKTVLVTVHRGPFGRAVERHYIRVKVNENENKNKKRK